MRYLAVDRVIYSEMSFIVRNTIVRAQSPRSAGTSNKNMEIRASNGKTIVAVRSDVRPSDDASGSESGGFLCSAEFRLRAVCLLNEKSSFELSMFLPPLCEYEIISFFPIFFIPRGLYKNSNARIFFDAESFCDGLDWGTLDFLRGLIKAY